MSGHILCDFDATLAHYESGWAAQGILGKPIPLTLERVKQKLQEGVEVRIFTARVYGSDCEKNTKSIQDWTQEYLGVRLPVTCMKDWDTLEIWDDRARSFEYNTGRSVKYGADGLIRTEVPISISPFKDAVIKEQQA